MMHKKQIVANSTDVPRDGNSLLCRIRRPVYVRLYCCANKHVVR